MIPHSRKFVKPALSRVRQRVTPRALRRMTVLVTGCGDVGLRLIRQLRARSGSVRVIATARRSEQIDAIRAAGGVPIRVDLEDRVSLRRLKAFSKKAVHLAPPPSSGPDDPRSRRIIAALSSGVLPAFGRRWAYVSTTGVYGDCAGGWIDETQPSRARTERALRRVAAERRFRRASRHGVASVAMLRAPGIYADDRLPVDRLLAGMPALIPAEDVWTNHIHAEDLAHCCWLALFRGRPGRTYNTVDESQQKMGEYFDQVADALGLARPPRLPRAELARQVSPMMLSFMNESRRIGNRRLREELRVRLRFPTVKSQLALLNSQDSLV
jgi:nucleoside-diphosphate-sugar epimerase